MTLFEDLKWRGLIKDVAGEESELQKILDGKPFAFYWGTDPTADSLHLGHYSSLCMAKRLANAGHQPVLLCGGATGRIGDPRPTAEREIISEEKVNNNINGIRNQIKRLVPTAELVDNYDWMKDYTFLNFLRDIGVYFSVNKMLTAECFKQRLERGLSFLEFNYMLMQSYDFLVLCQKYGCLLECGGDDQWSNILAGADLIRRKEGKAAFAMTFELLTTSEGKKMGKTQKGAVWLDAKKTTPYEFYQYFRNVDDADVNKCMRFLTFLEMDEINELTKYQDERMNAAKERLAYEVTKIVHGEEEAAKAQAQARGAFGGNEAEMPSVEIELPSRNVIDVLVATGVAKSKGEARRLIDGKGVKIDDGVVETYDRELTDSEANNGFVLHKGKKVHLRVKIK